ncbi:VOC family protein [Corynebacterium sanguinis]|uniref:VOC family protein n=1 Tax=Corynebacterium sanguinis TaxID=2594913 RepID=UPI00223AABCE|nr:VOC family protein [Corynebacterium sanguinis]MCT1444476.1 VOC family protein [Corynebacterium sanguinis]MCT1597382.1 VOC family protein [Corynebacterium sanguinis]MCT2153729.1 VOC family protein [Corynebacterium sanguinis]
MAQTVPYLSFHGNATEMFGYYHSIFGGELKIMTYGEQMNNGAEFPFEAPRDAVAHGTLTGVFNLAGGDDLEDNSGVLNRGDFSFVVEVDSVDEGNRIIEALTRDGGRVTMPFMQAPWGDHYGQCEDKYGMAWHVSTAA